MLHVLSVIIIYASLTRADAFPQRTSPTDGPIHTLILTRHGDSLWNGKYPGCRETFTGWTDVDLSPIGEQEALRTGQLLTQYTSGVNIDALFTSTLKRAKITAHHCWWAYYEIGCQAPSQFVIDYRLNERHYGSLQGLVKADCELGMYGHSTDDVYEWRRSWNAIPPPLDDSDPIRKEELRMFGGICGEENIPRSESLACVARDRIRPFLDEKLTPLLDSASEGEVGGTALVVAHANSLRALIGVICNVEGQRKALKKLEKMKIPTASPMILRYRTTKDGSYVPVGSALDDELKNVFPVYPLSYLPQLRKQNNASEDDFSNINETDNVDSKAKQYGYKPPSHSDFFLKHLESVRSAWPYDPNDDESAIGSNEKQQLYNGGGVHCAGEPAIDPSRMLQNVPSESDWI